MLKVFLSGLKNAFVGMGATIVQLISIGINSIIGAGAVVIKSVEDNLTEEILKNNKIQQK